MKKNANDSEIFHTILQKMTSISWQYICHQRRLISSESYSLAQEVDKKFLKDFYSMISISYLYIYSYKRLISCGHIIIERDHLENRLISCKTSLSTKDQSFFLILFSKRLLKYRYYIIAFNIALCPFIRWC